MHNGRETELRLKLHQTRFSQTQQIDIITVYYPAISMSIYYLLLSLLLYQAHPACY